MTVITTLRERWEAVVASVKVLHIDPTCTPVLEVFGNDDLPTLLVAVRHARDTLDQNRRIAQLNVSCVNLTYWPGATLAERWIAAAWSGYIQHEALELVTVAGIRPLDPHGSPPDFDRGLRCGLPVDLTPKTLERTLALVMDPVLAAEMVRHGGG